jgi:integrase
MAKTKTDVTPVSRGRTIRASREGYTFVLEDDEWPVSRSDKIPWYASDLQRIDPTLLATWRQILAELLEEVSGVYARGVFDTMTKLLESSGEQITIAAFESWWQMTKDRQDLSDRTKSGYLARCRAGIVAWKDSGFPGLEAGLCEQVGEISVKAGVTGRAVREMCPIRGPFTQAEELALTQWMHHAYANNTLSMQQYALLLLALEFGPRPVELASLRACDVFPRADGSQSYFINMPTAKGERDYRKVFRELELRTDLYALLTTLHESNKTALCKAWNSSIPPQVARQLPLLAGTRLLNAGSCEAFLNRIAKTPTYFHYEMAAFKWLAQKCPVVTARLNGDMLPLSVYRFRRTVATRLAEAGADDQTIAAFFGHSTTQSVQIYTAHTYEAQETCDAIMSEAWWPVLSRVEERLISQPIPGQAKVHVTREDTVGNCSRLCGGGILTCYPCAKFHPFVDGPHEKSLAYALGERQKRIDKGLSGPEVDSLDLPIAAIQQTIVACAARREREGTHG